MVTVRQRLHSILPLLAVLISISSVSFAQCSLSGAIQWNASSGTWSTPSNWAGGVVPDSSSTNVCLTNGSATTNLDGNRSVASLQIGASNSLTLNNGTQLNMNGPSLINAGSMTLGQGGGSAYLYLTGSTKISGGGTLTLTNSSYIFGTGGALLENAGNTIQGSGFIGANFTIGLQNDAGQIINANVNGGVLYIDPSQGTVNLGTLEATNGGLLDLSNYNVNKCRWNHLDGFEP